MRIVMGKHVRQMDAAQVAAWTAAYDETAIDLGAGDGRFVRRLARRYPESGAIGVDLCQENLAVTSRTAASNALYVIADALALPAELIGAAARVTINFPWGSLLRGLLAGNPGLLSGLEMIGNDRTTLEIQLNAGALAEAGWTLDRGSERIMAVLRDAGLSIGGTRVLGSADLRQLPTTWAKRLAFGRDPRAIQIDTTLTCPIPARIAARAVTVP